MHGTVALVLLLLGWAISPSAGQPGPDYEDAPVFRAADRVDAATLSGEYHRVDDRVVNDGFMNHFTIRSDFGVFEASSERMLETRVREVYAIAELRELSRSDAFKSALKGAATAPVDTVTRVVDDPVGTAKGLPGGVTRKVRGLYYSGRKTAHKVNGEIDEARADEPADEGDGEGAAGAAAEGESEKESTSAKAAAAAKDYVGYSSALRKLAKELQVDPYSTNAVLQAELRRLAQAAFAAGIAFKVAVPVPRAIGLISDVSNLVWDTPPEELERLNNLALRDLGVDKQTRLEFFASPALTTTTQTLLVEDLKRLAPLDGRGAVVELAVAAESEDEVWLLVRAVRMLASYHALLTPFESLMVAGNDELGRVAVGVTAANEAIVPVPFDHVTWQPGMEGTGPLSSLQGRELWLARTLSPRAKSELEKRGFEIHEGAAAHFADLAARGAAP